MSRGINTVLWQDRYDKYLRTEHWQKIRRFVFERDKGQCVYCKRELTLETMVCHHISYELYNKLGQADAYECRTLCHGCHAKVHRHIGKGDALVNKVLESIRKKKTDA